MTRVMSLFVLVAATGCAMVRADTKDGSMRVDARTGGTKTSMFEGVKANTGYAVATKEKGRLVLTLSDDFKVPDTPAPHWQVVDTKGNVYLLQRLMIKEDKYNKTIVVPSYVNDVAKVQIWCAWAETLLGEASFKKPVR